jgi:hypothetical protein
LFDNRTGRFRDHGNVDCDRAEGIGAEHYSSALSLPLAGAFTEPFLGGIENDVLALQA